MRIVMMGTGTFAEPTLQALLAAGEQVVGLVTQPDRDVGRRTGASRQVGVGMAAIAAAAGVPVIQPPSINVPEGLAALQAFQPDLLVVAAYGQILKPAVLRVGKLGAINVHASLLPRHRGASPVAHAIWAGDSTTGVTIIRITPGLDAGAMLAQEAVAIARHETAGELEARLAPLGARLAVAVVQHLKAGSVTGTVQDEALVTRAPKLTKEMGLVNWQQPAERVRCQVYAMQPWPTAYTFFLRPGKEPMRMIVSRVGEPQAQPDAGQLGPIGVLVPLPGESFGVLCSDSNILPILELQPAGKKRMSATEFIRGYPIRSEHRFGPAGQ